MMQAVLDWMRMEGYGWYVWSVLGVVVVVISYEVGRLKAAQRRSWRQYKSLNEDYKDIEL